MSRLLFACLWRNGLRALAVLLPFSTAVAAPIYDIPITLYGQFYRGGAISGSFSLTAYGYGANGPWTISLGAGTAVDGLTAIPAVTFGSALQETLGASGPSNGNGIDAIKISTNGYNNAPPLFDLTFQHSLGIPGPDPFVIDVDVFNASPDSAECNGFSCTSSNERLVGSGAAEVPEPTPLPLLAGGLLMLVATRRRAGALRGRLFR